MTRSFFVVSILTYCVQVNMWSDSNRLHQIQGLVCFHPRKRSRHLYNTHIVFFNHPLSLYHR